MLKEHPFFPPTDFLSMDQFAGDNGLPMGFAYPHDSPTSPEGFLVECPGEVFPVVLLSIQDCPAETQEVDPSNYIDGAEIPMWLLHGLSDPLLPFNQALVVYEATTAEGNEARLTLVPGAGHDVGQVLAGTNATTWVTNRGGQETVTDGRSPTWDDIEHFIHVNLSRGR
ncbi:MAG TPA: hypothetical protein VEB69_03735 [Acidimicrobiia bacterium]|nr:hypothetical protein [Acidimicrobiia bacterium]